MSPLLNIANTKRLLAQIIGILCYPLWIPTYGMVMFCFGVEQQGISLSLPFWLVGCIGTFFLTAFIPLSMILFMIHKGQISDMYINRSSERTYPYLYTIICYLFWCYFLHAILHIPIFFLVTAIGSTLALVVVLLINFRWKISSHLCGLGGLTGGIIGFCFEYSLFPLNVFLITLLVALLTMYARLYLKAHSPLQVCIGYLVGLCSTCFPNLFLYLLNP